MISKDPKWDERKSFLWIFNYFTYHYTLGAWNWDDTRRNEPRWLVGWCCRVRWWRRHSHIKMKSINSTTRIYLFTLFTWCDIINKKKNNKKTIIYYEEKKRRRKIVSIERHFKIENKKKWIKVYILLRSLPFTVTCLQSFTFKVIEERTRFIYFLFSSHIYHNHNNTCPGYNIFARMKWIFVYLYVCMFLSLKHFGWRRFNYAQVRRWSLSWAPFIPSASIIAVVVIVTV